jgi:hypothetical protein
MLFTAKILLTIATLGYSAIPAVVDANKTHATNPSWDPHARFHVVWQVSSYVYVALIALYLIWTAGTDHWPLWIAAFLALGAYGGFWTAVFSRSAYGGTLVSRENAVPDITWKFLGPNVKTDANVTAFSIFVGLLMIGMICLGQT